MASPHHGPWPSPSSSDAAVARRSLCELCHSPAAFLCPSDEAALCWRCDSMVHGANFLVARHRREFLCCICSRPTASFTTGARLPVESHICSRCSPSSNPGDGHGGSSPSSFDRESESSCTGCSGLTDCDIDSDTVVSSEIASGTFGWRHHSRSSIEEDEEEKEEEDEEEEEEEEGDDGDDMSDIDMEVQKNRFCKRWS